MSPDYIRNPTLSDFRILGISASPRKNGNSDVLLKHIFKGINQKEINAEKIRDPSHTQALSFDDFDQIMRNSGLKNLRRGSYEVEKVKL